MRHLVVALVVIAFIAASSHPAKALSVKDGDFYYRGRPITLLGDSFQGALGNAQLDYEKWLDDVKSEGLNCVAFWGLWPVRQFKDGRNADGDRWGTYPVDALMPWARTDPGLGYDGFPKYNFSQWDDRYWQRIADLCRAASKRGIIVQISLFDECYFRPLEIDGIPRWWWHPFCWRQGGPLHDDKVGFAAYGMEKEPAVQLIERNYVRKMLEVTAPFDNVCFEVCNEGSMFSDRWNHYWLKFVKAYSDAPVGINANFTQCKPSEWLKAPDCDYLTFHDYFDFERNVALYRKFCGHGKAIVIDEANPEYRGTAPGGTPPKGFLPAFWAAALCGAHYMLQDDSPCEYASTTTRYRNGHQGRLLVKPLADLLQQAGGRLKPFPKAVKSQGKQAVAAGGKGLRVVYLPAGCKSASLQVLGTWQVRWLDVAAGTEKAAPRLTAKAGTLTLVPPSNTKDYVAILERCKP